MEALIQEILDFLPCPTPQAWIDSAIDNIDILLIDHAHCEKKAASTALSMIYRYPDKTELLQQMSRLAREELRHFEQVLKIMSKRGISYQHLSPSRYAEGMRKQMRNHEPAQLIDVLIIGAFIEARSCERFAALIPYLDEELAGFYQSLLQSEARHFKHYLEFAHQFANCDIQDRINVFAAQERALIEQSDDEFRFHSGASTARCQAPVPDPI